MLIEIETKSENWNFLKYGRIGMQSLYTGYYRTLFLFEDFFLNKTINEHSSACTIVIYKHNADILCMYLYVHSCVQVDGEVSLTLTMSYRHMYASTCIHRFICIHFYIEVIVP